MSKETIDKKEYDTIDKKNYTENQKLLFDELTKLIDLTKDFKANQKLEMLGEIELAEFWNGLEMEMKDSLFNIMNFLRPLIELQKKYKEFLIMNELMQKALKEI